MKRKTSFIASFKDNKLELNDKLGFLKTLKRFNDNKQFLLTIEDMDKPRSLLQNNYFWGVVIETIKDYTGDETPESLYNTFILRFSTHKVEKIINGKKMVFVHQKTLSDMNNQEATDFVNKIIDFAETEMNCRIPTPEEYYQGVSVEVNLKK